MRWPHVGDEIDTLDGIRRIVSYDGVALKLFDEANHAYEVVAASSLPLIMTSAPDEDVDVSPRLIDTVPEGLRREAVRRAGHVREVLEGCPRPGCSPDPAYDPTTTNLSDRKARKARELGVSTSTIDNWIARFRRGGVSALIDRRQLRRSGGIHASEEFIAALKEVIDAQTKEPTRTFGSFYDQLFNLCRARGIADEVKSESTVHRQAEALTKGKFTFGSARSRRAQANVPDRMFRPRPAVAPGSEVQIDSSPGDFEALDYMGHRTRLKLTAMIDKATRGIPAVGASMISAKAVDHAMLIARALVPQQSRPHPELLATVLDRIEAPWLKHLSAAEVERCYRIRPYIRIQRIVYDNGRDYDSNVFRSACQKFEISCTEAGPYSPDDKPLIERFWLTVNKMFSQYVPGYVGNSVENRGLGMPDSELLRIDELIELFDLWVTVIYQNRVHSGLIDPFDPGAPRTPNSMFMAFHEVSDAIPLALTRDDYIDILPVEERTIQADGIQLGYGKYDAPALTALRRIPSLDGRHDNKWQVHWDPYDQRFVWVADPASGEWIECELKNAQRAEQPFAVRIRRESKRFAKEEGYIGDKEARQLTEKLMAGSKQARQEQLKDQQRRAFALQERAAVGIPDLAEPNRRRSSARNAAAPRPDRSRVGLCCSIRTLTDVRPLRSP